MKDCRIVRENLKTRSLPLLASYDWNRSGIFVVHHIMISLIHLSADILVDTKQEICSLNCSKQGECQKEEQIRFHSGWSEVWLIDLIHSYQVIFNQSSYSNSRIRNAQRNCDHNLFQASLQSLYSNRSSSPKSFGSVLTLEIKCKWLLLLWSKL